ncbi:MAG: lysozyme inhibitor LprI family protein [Beijerinckiaceae bacterium]|nr:lysozyme inhibitor LprI family protein [Beijerinckiaceae bacterium]MCZ8301503.1 lysozyme inhibitor LprI family protein [Beijerinckiaceae bacterium]
MRILTPAARAAVFLAGTAFSAFAQAPETPASFDCRKAVTARERATCATEDARRTDSEMAAAYAPLLSRLSPPQAAALKESQRQFNAYADRLCAVDRARKPDALGEVSQCLAELMTQRAGHLAGLSVVTVDGIRIEPRLRTEFRIHPADDPSDRRMGWITEDVMPVMSGAPEPAMKAFEAALRRMIAPEKPLIAGRITLNGAVTRTYAVSYLGQRLLSLQFNEHVDAGTAVPDRDVGLNIDMMTGAPVSLSAVFERNANWRKVMHEALRRDINRPDELDERLEEILSGGKGVIWAFGADKVTVSWTTLSPPAESAEIPLAEIARFIRPDSPWRPATR